MPEVQWHIIIFYEERSNGPMCLFSLLLHCVKIKQLGIALSAFPAFWTLRCRMKECLQHFLKIFSSVLQVMTSQSSTIFVPAVLKVLFFCGHVWMSVWLRVFEFVWQSSDRQTNGGGWTKQMVVGFIAAVYPASSISVLRWEGSFG